MAANCIDDQENTFCHSQEEDWPWLSIELPNPSTVRHVIIFNRQQSAERLSPFQLWVGTSAGDYNSATSSHCGVNNLTAPATAGPFAFACGSLSGSFLTLVLPGPMRTLNLNEMRSYT